MALWRRNSGELQELPFADYDPTGTHWTDLVNNPDGRAACGWVEDPAAVPPPAPPRPPAVLSRLGFVGLVQAAGGMTDFMLMEAADNVLFRAFWVKFQMAEQVEKGDPITVAALTALEEAGYLPNGSSAVLSAWPAS